MHHVPWDVQHRRRALVPIVVLVVMAVLTVGVVASAALSVGLVAGTLSTLLGLLPVIPAALLLLWVDKWEPEPGRLLVGAFLWGAGISIVTALIGSWLLDLTWAVLLSTQGGNALSIAATAPIVEEACKGLFLLWLFSFRRREFGGVVDGIVYAGMVGLGFAFTENIFYLGAAFSEDGLAGGLVLFFLRCVLSPFAHPLFTSMIGIGLGLAVTSARPGVRFVAPVAGYCAAVALHATWNGSTLLIEGGGFLLVYAFVMVPMFVGLTVLLLWQRKRLQRILAAQLPGMVTAGLVPPHEVNDLASLAGRRRWRAAVRQRLGPDAVKGLRDYQAIVTELAVFRDRVARGAVGKDRARTEQELLAGLRTAQARGHRAALAAAATAAPPNPYLH